MNTFISYASDIKEMAGKIKEYLDLYGFSCFLAHENIPPQRKWPAKIVEKLKHYDFFFRHLLQNLELHITVSKKLALQYV